MAMTTRPPRPAAAPPVPTMPAPVAAATGAFWGAISALRGRRRGLHTNGDAYEARFVVDGAGHTGAPLFDEPGSRIAIARLSRGAGLPEPVPDVLGIAVRVLDAHGPGAHQDFLLATSADLPVAHHLLLPALSFFKRSFSSVLPYSIGESTRLIGAKALSAAPHDGDEGLGGVSTAATRGDLQYELMLAAPLGRFERVARLELGARLPAAESERLRFNPWNTGGGIKPIGPFQGVRLPAYEGSQSGRRT